MARPNILLVCGYYHKAAKKEACSEANAKDIAAGCDCISASSTTSGDYFVRVLQQQPNLRELVWRLKKAADVHVVFMYDIAHKKLARVTVPGITHVVLSGGNYDLENIDADYLFATVGDKVLGICQGFHLICKKFAAATIVAGEPHKSVDDVSRLFENATGVLAAGDKTQCAFNHAMYAKNATDAVMKGDYAIAYESGKVVGVQWHPEQDDSSWELVQKFLSS